MAFPPEKEKKVILRESILVKAASTSSVKGLLGQKFDLKLRHIELVDWNQSTFLLIYKQKSGTLVPLISIRLTPPLSVASGQVDGFFQLFPTGGEEIVLNFTNRESRDKWLDSIRTASSALKSPEKPLSDVGVSESKGDDSKSVASTSSAPITTVPQLVMSLKPHWENKTEGTNIGQMGNSAHNETALPAVVRDRNHGLSRSLTIGGEHEPSARRKNKDTPAVDSMLAANKEPLIPQPTVPPRPEPHLSPIFNPHATPLYAVPTQTTTSMNLEELSEIEPMELTSDEANPLVDSSTPGFVHKVIEKIEKKVHKTSQPPPPDLPPGQDRQLTEETMSKIQQTVETVFTSNSLEVAGALESSENDDGDLLDAPVAASLASSPTPTSKVQFADEAVSPPQSNLLRFLSSPSQPVNAELLQAEVQALTLMNDQLNEALEASESMHRKEVESVYAEMLRLQSHLREVQEEKEFFIATNTEAMAQVFQMQAIQKEKDQVTVDYAELQKKYDALQEQNSIADSVKQSLISDQQASLDKVRSLEESLSRKDEELLVLNKKLISTSEALMQKTEELYAREQDGTNRLHELAEVGTEMNILHEKVRVLEEVEMKYKDLQLAFQSKCDRIVNLEADLQQCRISIKGFQANDETHSVTVTRLESLIKEQQSFASELSAQLQIERKRKEELADMQAQHISLLEELHRVKGEKSELERELVRQKTSFSSLEKEFDKVKDEYDEKFNKKNAELQSKRKELEMHVMDMEHLKSELSVVQKRFDLLKNQSSKEVSQQEAQLSRLRIENKDLSDQLTSLKVNLSSSHEVQHAQILQAQSTEVQLRQTVRDLEQRLRELDEMHGQMKELALQHGSNVILLEQEKLELQQMLSVEKSKYVGTNWKLEVKEQQHQAEKKALSDQLADLQSKTEETNRILLQRDVTIEDLQLTIAAMQGRIDQSARELEQCLLKHDHETKRLQVQLEGLREEKLHEIRSFEEQLTQVTKAKDALEMSYSELNAQYQKYKADHYAIENELSGQLSELQAKHMALFNEHDKLQNDYHTLQQTVTRTSDENIKLSADVGKLNEERTRIALERDELDVKYNAFVEERSLAEKAMKEAMGTKDEQLHRLTTSFQELENGTTDQIKVLKRRVESLEETLLHSNDLTKKAQSEKRSIEAVLAEKQKAYDMLLVAIGQYESKLEDSQTELSRATLLCAEQQTKLRSFEDDLEKRSDIEKSSSHAQQILQEELNNAIEENKLLRIKCTEKDSKLTSSVNQFNDLEKEHKYLLKALEEKHQELEEAKASVVKVEKLLENSREDWQLTSEKNESKLQQLSLSLATTQESFRGEKLLLEKLLAEKEAQVTKLETEVSFLQANCLSLEQTNKRNQERFSTMIEGDLVHQELTRYQSELDNQRKTFDTLYSKYISLQKQYSQSEEEKVTYSSALDKIFALLVEYYAQPDSSKKSKLESSLSEYATGIEISVEHLYGHFSSLNTFLTSLLPLLSSYDSDSIPVYDGTLLKDESSPEVTNQLQFIISSIERLDDGSFDNYSLSRALFDNVLALLKSLFVSAQSAQFLRTDLTSVREELQVSQRTAGTLADDKKVLEERIIVLEEKMTAQLNQMNNLSDTLQASHNSKVAALLEEGRVEELHRKELISSLKATIQQHIEKQQQDAITVAGLRDEIKILEEQWDQSKVELVNVRGQLQTLQAKYTADTKELNQLLKALEYSKEELVVQIMQKDNAISLNIEQRMQLEQQMQSMQASYKETIEKHVSSVGQLKKEVGLLQQDKIDLEMKVRLLEQELGQSVDSQNALSGKLQGLTQHYSRVEDDYKTRLESARSEIQELEKKLEKANALIYQKEKESAALQAGEQEHLQQLRILQTLYDDLQEKCTQQTRNHDQALASYNSKLQSLSRIQQERESSIQNELSAVQLQLQDHVYEIEKLQVQVQQKEKEIEQYKIEKADAMKQYEDFTQSRLDKDKKLTQSQLESQQQIHSLSTQLTLLQHSVTSKEQEIIFLQQNVENLQAEMEKANADYYGREEKLVEETYKLKLDNKEYAYQLDKLNHLNDLLEESVKERDGLVHSLQTDYGKLDQQYQTCEKEKVQFEKDLKEYKAKYENTLRELQQREKEIAKLAQDKLSLEEQVTDLRKHLLEQEEALSRDLMQLQSEYRSLQATHDKLSLSSTSKDRECVRLKEEKVVLEKEYSSVINKLRDQDEESQKAISSLSLEHQELKVKCEKLQILVHQKEQDSIKLNVERSALAKQLEALQIESKELEEGYEKNLESLQVDLADCGRKFDKIQMSNQQKEKEIASLTEEKNNLKIELETCSRRLHSLELSSQSELVSLRATCQKLSSELSNATDALASRELEAQQAAQERQVLAKEYAANTADLQEKLQTVQQQAGATADKLARLQQQHDLIQIDYTKAQQDADYLRDKLSQQERKMSKLQADCEEKQRLIVQETRSFQEQKQEWTELNNKQHLAIERKEQELISLRSDLQASKVQLKEKSEKLADLSNTHQMVELSLARTTREKQEAEKLLRKSVQHLRFSHQPGALSSSRGAEESSLSKSSQREEQESIAAPRRSQSRALEDAMHQRIARSLSASNPANLAEPTRRFQSPSPATGKKLGVRDLL